MSPLRLAGAAAAWLLAAPPAGAEEVVHAVEQGETLSDLAQRYWGEAGWAELLRTHNGLQTRSAPRGTKIRIPVASEHRVGPGETWASIAKRALGDAAFGRLVARLNGRDPAVRPKAGETIRIPVLVDYRLGRGETLASLSRRFLTGTGDWPLLAKLNGIENPSRLRAGTRLRIPVVPRSRPPDSPAALPKDKPRPAPVAPAPVSAPPERASEPLPAAPPPHAKKTPARVKAILQAGVNAYFEGRYEEARDQMEALRPEMNVRGSTGDRVELLEYLTLVHVAFDDGEAACRTYRALRAVDPEQRWDPVRVSPKVSRTTSLCDAR